MSEAPEYKARVLVVDDDQAVALTLSQYLAIWGYQVVTADSVDAARVRLKTETELDVVMLDIKMPGASGVEFLPELKRGWPDLEVVFLTAYATLETAVEAVRHGASDFLLKPVSDMERQLLPVLERCLEHRRLVQANQKLQAEVQEANRRLQAANRDLKRSLATSDTLLKTAQSVAGMRSAKALLDLARDSLQYGLQIERGLVVTRPTAGGGWTVARQVGLDGLGIEGRSLDGAPVGTALDAGRVQCVEGRTLFDLAGWAWIYPMVLGTGEVLGAIVACSAGKEPRKEHEDTGLRILAAQMAPALKLLGGAGAPGR